MSFRKMFTSVPFLFFIVLLAVALAIFESRAAAEDTSDIRYVLEEELLDGNEEGGQELQPAEVVDDSGNDEKTESTEENNGDSSENGGSTEIGGGEVSMEDASSGSCSSSVDSGIVISELLINPEGTDTLGEFIEIYNTGNTKVDITGWTLSDQSGKVKTFSILETYMDSGEYKVFYYSETKISLNNDGDGVILSDINGCQVFATLISGAAEEGFSYALDENKNWQWTIMSTPGGVNIIDAGGEAINDPEDGGVD
ncbi:MAG: lamin tail domain-containing protein, partial [Candidatus Pacebacteria bacterium]|nr:lamin tail domain-containing protein [Candidatus Paceibacterota bacterium]